MTDGNFRGRNLGCKTRHLRRAPSEMFRPVVVNPWVREDVTLNQEHLPWIPGDRHETQPVGNNDDAEDAMATDQQARITDRQTAVTNEQAIVVHQSEDEDTDLTIPDGESTQLAPAEQNVDEDDNRDDINPALQNTEQETVEEEASLSPREETPETKTTYRTRSQAVNNTDVTMQDASEQDESSSDDPDRVYCICQDLVDGGTMIQCDNHRDSDVSYNHAQSFLFYLLTEMQSAKESGSISNALACLEAHRMMCTGIAWTVAGSFVVVFSAMALSDEEATIKTRGLCVASAKLIEVRLPKAQRRRIREVQLP